ncbi:MAG TPA: hypothetical protein VG603_13550 [Chitinophagales bacterium]|nr:hypothetical protein [Chitinophagales bacterium]
MRVVSTLAIIGLIMFNLFGFYFAFVVKQGEIKQASFSVARTQPGQQALILSTYDYQHLQWREKGKEFSRNGVLYDVNSIKEANGKVVMDVTCDDAENELLDNFITLFTGKTSNDSCNQPLKNLLEHFMQQFTHSTYNAGFLIAEKVERIVICDKDVLNSSVISLLSPPPDFAG